MSFCVDTGADKSLLMPIDGVRMGIDYSKLNGDAECLGFGGICHNFIEGAILAFSEPNRYIHIYSIILEIASPTPDVMDIPSVIGREILDRWRMIYDPVRDRLVFTVHSADLQLPISVKNQ